MSVSCCNHIWQVRSLQVRLLLLPPISLMQIIAVTVSVTITECFLLIYKQIALCQKKQSSRQLTAVDRRCGRMHSPTTASPCGSILATHWMIHHIPQWYGSRECHMFIRLFYVADPPLIHHARSVLRNKLILALKFTFWFFKVTIFTYVIACNKSGLFWPLDMHSLMTCTICLMKGQVFPRTDLHFVWS